jgi:hypothetical protein
MAMITSPILTRPARLHTITEGLDRHAATREALRLAAIALAAAVAGAALPATAFALFVGSVTGSEVAAASVAAMGLPFLAITIPTMAIWLLGAIQTERAIRRLHR